MLGKFVTGLEGSPSRPSHRVVSLADGGDVQAAVEKAGERAKPVEDWRIWRFIDGLEGGEVDIKGFFTDLDHDWMVMMLAKRVKDRPFGRLIQKWMRAGVLEEDRTVLHPATGTPQGGIILSVLSNIYLH